MTAAHSSRAFLGLSHTPLLGLATVPQTVEAELLSALDILKSRVLAWAPDRVVLVAPDHYNGFFNELMPTFCVGTDAVSVGDYLMPSGPLRVDTHTALALSTSLMDAGFDLSVSRRMRVDHAFVQPLVLLWGSLQSPPVVPVFLNALAGPTIARVGRCIELGQALGRFLDTLPGRTLVIGSGGLSHEPPAPTMDHPDPAVRERIIARVDYTPAQRQERTQRAMEAGLALSQGAPGTKPLNPDWDRRWMDALEHGDLGYFSGMAEHRIEADAGRSAHESKTWLVARCSLGDTSPRTHMRHYQAIPELIAGFGVLFMDTPTPEETQPS
ncbi:3-carboxyethylcatechol 2,3-dioxygenase [Hydrogenophaga sp. BPS33]|uniref:3-carboxyethylcatechol 2,3-dioxygenase n=1 Tax=Hydrogenophaga sp. BPS33 TaxID=2651974 RepID=UPI00131F8537|nr:3-carboxyethylcatechol 2,3-dioxygenase [Hydrogenophaga sp. BPS33]QHE85474.1 3-carboxyethylcatechol 2,3-dioxygenase [Hydrogenophaga sp. BPS33]